MPKAINRDSCRKWIGNKWSVNANIIQKSACWVPLYWVSVSGASLGVAVAILAGMDYGDGGLTQIGIGGSWILTISASLGAFCCFVCSGAGIHACSGQHVSINSRLNVLEVLQEQSLPFFNFSVRQKVYRHILVWTFGSLGGLTWMELKVFIPVVIIALAGTFFSF